MAKTDQQLAQEKLQDKGIDWETGLNFVDRQIGKFNAGMIDATLGLHDLAVTGLSSLGNYIFGRNNQPYLLADRAKSALNVETDTSSPLYMAGAIAPAVMASAPAALTQGASALRAGLGLGAREASAFAGSEAGAQIGSQYGDTGQLVGSVLGGSLTPTGPTQRRDIWAGPEARTADHDAIAEAIEMERRGVDANEIKLVTGFQRNLDGNWMYHLPDNKSSLNAELMRQDMQDLSLEDKVEGTSTSFQRPLGEILDHPELYEAYPDVYNIPVTYGYGTSSSRGSYYPRGLMRPVGEIDLNLSRTRDPDDANPLGNQTRSTLIHEIGHAVSDIEGRSAGGSPDTAYIAADRAKLAELAPYFDDKIKSNEVGFEIDNYEKAANIREKLNKAGEMSDEQRRSFIANEVRNNPFSDQRARIFNAIDATEDEFKKLYNDALSRYAELNPSRLEYDRINKKYHEISKLPARNQYQLMNDEYLQRTAQKLIDDPRSTYEVPLYREIEGMDLSPESMDYLYNVPRQ